MASWKKILKGVLPDKIASDNKILDNVHELKIGADNTSQKQVIVNNGVLNIYNTPQEKAANKTISKIKLEELDKGDIVAEIGSSDKLVQIQKTLSDTEVLDEINKFKGAVPARDMPILEAAIIIQSQYNRGIKVVDLLRDISIRYGKRGSMICHLYSAGYFDDILLPSYREIVESDDPDTDFYNDLYEMIVTESPLAIFVSHRDKAEQLAEQIIKKIKINKELGLNYINIHGIGLSNVECIEKTISLEQVQKLLNGEPVKKTEKNMTTITIYF